MSDSHNGVVRTSSPKRNLQFYGAPVGILMVQRATTDDPFDRFYPPGSVNNASTWSVPVRYKPMLGLTFPMLQVPNNAATESIAVKAAVELAREGASFITANCGFMVRYQEAVRAAVDIPVCLSPLVLAPFLERMLPPTKSVGIITAKAPFTPDLLEAAGILPDCRRVSIVGLEKSPSFASVILNATANMDVDAVEAETVRAALDLQAKRPDIGVFLLECSELPPYAAAVQRATGVPVFDYTSMVEFFVRGVVPRRFYGIT
ncbi:MULTISPECIES: aspartate/glutamate racemase family protein [Bradyrhizobium]|uniref:aspartate/glutamate racemase family protein n=1 Tax=Bradyrhizobium TaxID=374 RepID=UPI000231DB65|nr:aspartate/glutamate racemase family protein [Bradyrhizobium japonicum]AJA65498.1 hypothetical protein RN69_38385 [Bradyrhizobium japonicum]KMK00044.1 hypothetical protein CF64_05175 [Bradyrhizobium japonicum]MCS3537378.1 Asp/Glu/hydantoin racemase [Bradyrhizobium japonicum]MCS3986535.1 Asp/Glu/hydantoin racemase [Bradyrhizobium japonicum]MCS4018651.1 Asp/Glu/hydantoin racemase [Bradyrhizobium japonicum]